MEIDEKKVDEAVLALGICSGLPDSDTKGNLRWV